MRPPASEWLVAWLRSDQEYWNWLHEHAAGFAKSWFEWLNWIVILGALEVVATRYHSRLAAIILYVSYMLILFYFHSIYWNSAPVSQDSITGVHRRSVLSWVLAAIPALAVVTVAQLLAHAVSHVAS